MTTAIRYLLADFLRWLAGKVDPDQSDYKIGGTD